MLSLNLLGLVKDFGQEIFSTSSCPPGFLKFAVIPIAFQNWKDVRCKLRLLAII